jgi:hypothetical protein
MFAKSEWFKPRTRGWGLRPRTWHGWLYAVVWCAVIALPFCAFVAVGRVPEAVIWMFVSGGLMVWDVRQMRAGVGKDTVVPGPELASRPAEPARPEIEFLDESEGDESTLDTRGFHMSLRDSS